MPGGQIGFLYHQDLWRTSRPPGHPDREESFNLSPRDLGLSALNVGQLIRSRSWEENLAITWTVGRSKVCYQSVATAEEILV